MLQLHVVLDIMHPSCLLQQSDAKFNCKEQSNKHFKEWDPYSLFAIGEVQIQFLLVLPTSSATAARPFSMLCHLKQ
jgi:hypothetical protein